MKNRIRKILLLHKIATGRRIPLAERVPLPQAVLSPEEAAERAAKQEERQARPRLSEQDKSQIAQALANARRSQLNRPKQDVMNLAIKNFADEIDQLKNYTLTDQHLAMIRSDSVSPQERFETAREMLIKACNMALLDAQKLLTNYESDSEAYKEQDIQYYRDMGVEIDPRIKLPSADIEYFYGPKTIQDEGKVIKRFNGVRNILKDLLSCLDAEDDSINQAINNIYQFIPKIKKPIYATAAIARSRARKKRLLDIIKYT
jgi:hypothetical protein